MSGLFQLIVPFKSISEKRFTASSVERLRVLYLEWRNAEKIKPADLPVDLMVYWDRGLVGCFDFAGAFTDAAAARLPAYSRNSTGGAPLLRSRSKR